MKLRDLIRKQPTIDSDLIAYTSGAGKTFDEQFNNYVQQVETIERAVRIIANVISLCEFKTFKESTGGDLKPFNVKNVDLKFPNPDDTHIDFKRKMAASLMTQAASIIIAEPNKDKTVDSDINFYAYNPSDFSIEPDGTKLIKEFQYQAEDGNIKVFKPEQIIYINDSIDPSNLLYPLSRLQALNDVVTMQAGIVSKSKEYLSGGAKDSFIISAKDPIGEKQQKNIKGAFDQFMQSAGAQTMLINTELQVDKVSNSMSGSDMLEFFTKLNQIMLDQFNLPPALLGDYSASGANKNEELLFSLRVWFNTMMKPLLENIGLKFTKYFRTQLGIKNVVVKLDYSQVDILDDFIDAKVDRAIKLHKSGLMSLNEARDLAELPRVEEESADWHYMPQYLTGSAPITFENYDEEVERLLQNSSSTQDTPAGNSGDEDNTNVVDDTRGGDATGDNNES